MTQDEALALLKTGTSIFLTGQPGSGKTHTVNRYVRELQLQGADIPRLARELLFNLSSDKSGPTGTDDSLPNGGSKKSSPNTVVWLYRGANHGTNGRRQAHRKCTPKHYPYGRSENFGASGFCTDHPE